jgi:hypothetical protein
VVTDPGDKSPYVFSALIVLVLVLGWGIEAGLPGWKRDEWRRQEAEGSLGLPEKRTKDDDEDEGDWDMALNTYKSPGYCHLSLRDINRRRGRPRPRFLLG